MVTCSQTSIMKYKLSMHMTKDVSPFENIEREKKDGRTCNGYLTTKWWRITCVQASLHRTPVK